MEPGREAKCVSLGLGQGMISKPPWGASGHTRATPVTPPTPPTPPAVSPQLGLPRHVQPARHRRPCSEGGGTNSHLLMQTVSVWVQLTPDKAAVSNPRCHPRGDSPGDGPEPGLQPRTSSLLLIF